MVMISVGNLNISPLDQCIRHLNHHQVGCDVFSLQNAAYQRGDQRDVITSKE